MSPLLLTPPDPKKLAADFPGYILAPDKRLHRIDRVSHLNPWWFSNGTGRKIGRFDLFGADGTCYLAEAGVGALLEALQELLRTDVPVARRELDSRRQSKVFVPSTLRLADCTNPNAVRLGITNELHSTRDRDVTRRWAVAFALARFDGIRYFVQHDTSSKHKGIALFGNSGLASWPVASTGFIDGRTIYALRHVYGIEIRDTP